MIEVEIRPGAYYDSVVLMQLQRALAAMPAIEDAGVVMGTSANRDLLAQSNLNADQIDQAGPDDLIIVVRAADETAAAAAFAQVDVLLRQGMGTGADNEFLPKSLAVASQLVPEARWVLVSVPGRYAAGVAREALDLGRHVFLYSDNVALEDEVDLKQVASSQGLLVMGPDCGTAIVNGVGLGFANQVRRGHIGLVGASGTGLQLVAARIDQLGSGITHALGTGGRDLSEAVGALTACQALDLLTRDPDTRVIVLVSKPPASAVADTLLRIARASGKPTVVNFIGYRPTDGFENVHFVETLDAAAELAVELAALEPETQTAAANPAFGPKQRYLRGLFAGGTLAYEAQLILREYLSTVYANAPLDKRFKLAKATQSVGHTIVDLGEDEFTVGRLHPMMDNDLRIKRLHQEASDPEVAVILLDVILGHGAHPDPAAALAPAIDAVRTKAQEAGRHLEVILVIVGTENDPQDLFAQTAKLKTAGAVVEFSNEAAVRRAGLLVRQLNRVCDLPPVGLDAIHAPMAAINVGLAAFAESLRAQEAAVLQVDWRPPAGGNERLMGILTRLKSR